MEGPGYVAGGGQEEEEEGVKQEEVLDSSIRVLV